MCESPFVNGARILRILRAGWNIAWAVCAARVVEVEKAGEQGGGVAAARQGEGEVQGVCVLPLVLQVARTHGERAPAAVGVFLQILHGGLLRGVGAFQPGADGRRQRAFFFAGQPAAEGDVAAFQAGEQGVVHRLNGEVTVAAGEHGAVAGLRGVQGVSNAAGVQLGVVGGGAQGGKHLRAFVVFFR